MKTLTGVLGLPNNGIPTLLEMNTTFENGTVCGPYEIAAMFTEMFVLEYGAFDESNMFFAAQSFAQLTPPLF